MDQEDWYQIDNIDALDTPALMIYPDLVIQNIATVISMIDDVKRLRPHVKTNKSIEAVKLMIDAGIQKFKCATIAETEMLGICCAQDALLAYQPVGPKLQRFISIIKAYPESKISCLVDNALAAKDISAAAVSSNLTIPVYLDINVGQNRTGIKAGFEALQLYMDCDALPGIRPVGLHAYDGHIHDVNLELRKQRCNDAFKPVEKLQKQLKDKGYPGLIIVAGGSPTFPIHAKRKNVECSPGTFIYWDAGYQSGLPDQPFVPAALVVSRIISKPDDSTICLDLGHKSVSAENEIGKRVVFLNAPELVMISQSEEHLVADAGKKNRFKVGDVLYGLPYHICPTVALYESAITVTDHHADGEWKTIARDRKINI